MEAIGNRRAFEPLPGGGYVLALVDDGVRIEVRDLHRRDHALIAEVTILAEWAGVPLINGRRAITSALQNLSSQTARNTLAKHCALRGKTFEKDGGDVFGWAEKIDDACVRVIEAERTEDGAIVLDDAADDDPPQDFVVHGLRIPADSHSQIISDGGGLKSLIQLLVLGTMAKSGIPVAYFDWEWNASRHLARKRRLFGNERLECLFYKACKNPLAVTRDHLRRFCEERAIQFVAIDSIGRCCDGKLADDDVARAYNNALAELPPSLAAAHVPKTNFDPGLDAKAFGSAFFHNYARMTWTVRKQAGADPSIVTVMLVPQKQNDGERQQPVALEFTFAADRIDVHAVDPAAVDGLSDSLPLHARIEGLLRSGAQTIAFISEELGAKPDSVTKALKRSQAFTKVLGQDGIQRFGLAVRRAS